MKKERWAHVLWGFKSMGGYPCDIISVDTETHKRVNEPEINDLTLGWLIYERLNRPSSLHAEFFKKTADFWDYANTVALPKRVLYITALNLGFDARVLKAEEHLQALGYIETGYIGPKPFIWKWKNPETNQRIMLLDLSNFFINTPVKALGKALGMFKGDLPGGPAHDRYQPVNGCEEGSVAWTLLSKYCYRDTEIVHEGIKQWISFCTEHQLGPFKPTLAGQGLSCFRWNWLEPKDGKPEIYLHNNKAVLKLERDAYKGGLTDCFRIGMFDKESDTGKYDNIKGDVAPGFYYVDVNSEYPYMMAEQSYPVELLAYRSKGAIGVLNGEISTRMTRVDELQSALEIGRGVVARVRLNTDLSAADEQLLRLYPVVSSDGKLLFPVGRIEMALTTRELIKALEQGIIYDVLEMAIYRIKNVFPGYVDLFYKLKRQYKASGNKVFYAITKLFLNALYGKWGQHTEIWSPVTMQIEGYLEVFTDADTGKRMTVRSIGGLTEATDGVKVESTNSFCAIAAHITADSRLYIYHLREIAGTDHVYYTDTDSLMVDEVGYHRLMIKGYVDDEQLGKLKLEKNSNKLQIVAPKNYKFGETPFVRKGIRRDGCEVWVAAKDKLPEPSGNTWWQIQFEGFGGALRNGDLNTVRIRFIQKRLSNLYTKGIIDKNGWVRPFRMEMFALFDAAEQQGKLQRT